MKKNNKIIQALFSVPKTPEEKKKAFKRVILATSPFVALGILLLIFTYFSGGFATHCADINCFIVNANQCKPTIYEETSELGKISYSISSVDNNKSACLLTKEITELSPNEDPVLKKILEKKKMECIFPSGKFNGQWTSSLIEGLKDCHGELKDAIGQLLSLV